ncbi:MAG: ABC transporter permease [Chitinophagales bacterium]|nr:ABC transporter permease [Chitinophagales bacterium]MDW8427166.1 ABC transporter permease [Chitinophagales bacterium]
MSKIPVIIAREYRSRVLKPVFIITTLLVPFLMALIGILPFWIMSASKTSEKLAVIDESGIFLHQLKSSDELQYVFVTEPLDSLLNTFGEQGYTAILHIPAAFHLDQPDGIRYISDEAPGFTTAELLSEQLTLVVTRLRLQQVNLTPELVDQLSKPVSFTTVIKGKEGNIGLASAVGYFSGLLLYVLLLVYGNMVMRGVMEEKSSRIAEVIISSVKPFELMSGKIIGIALVGLTQFAIWIVLGLLFFSIFSGLLPDPQQILQQYAEVPDQPAADTPPTVAMAQLMQEAQNLPLGLILFGFIFYFLFGYLTYSSLFAAFGAAMTDESDQSLSLIVTAPIILAFILGIIAMGAPHSGIAVFGSIFPLTSPIVMPARLGFDPPTGELLLSMISLLLCFLLFLWMSAKIYRTGILLYGKKVTLREIGRWVAYKN